MLCRFIVLPLALYLSGIAALVDYFGNAYWDRNLMKIGDNTIYVCWTHGYFVVGLQEGKMILGPDTICLEPYFSSAYVPESRNAVYKVVPFIFYDNIFGASRTNLVCHYSILAIYGCLCIILLIARPPLCKRLPNKSLNRTASTWRKWGGIGKVD